MHVVVAVDTGTSLVSLKIRLAQLLGRVQPRCILVPKDDSHIQLIRMLAKACSVCATACKTMTGCAYGLRLMI